MPAQPLLPLVPRAAGALLCGFAASALAGVIPGTGTAPSASQLGATDAVAMQRSASHKGHVLLTPYFTAQNGQMTVLHLVNTDLDNGKVVKLRLRGAANGDSLLAMTLMLRPASIWTAAITAGPDGRAQITTADDTNCSAPRLTAGTPQPLLTDRLDPALAPDARANHTREGTVEAILAADFPADRDGSAVRMAAYGTTGVPRCDSEAVERVLLQDFTDERTAASTGFATPSGGISGTWYIIDVPGSATFSSSMTALEAVNSAGQPARGNYVLFPASDQAIDQPERYTADPLLVSAGLAGHRKDVAGVLTQPTTAAAVQARAYDLPDLSTPYRLPATAANAARTAAEASKALATSEISNQYSVESSISAQTDWIVAMPTKRYSVGLDYASGQMNFSAVPPAGEGKQYFYDDNSNSLYTAGKVCSGTDAWTFSRTGFAYMLWPENPALPSLCGVVGVFPVSKPTGRVPSMLAASVALSRSQVPSADTSGWSKLVINGPAGMPVIGGSLTKLVNPGAAPGMAASYGLMYPHMATRP